MPILQVLIVQGQQYFPAWLRGDRKTTKRIVCVSFCIQLSAKKCICLLVAVNYLKQKV